MTNKNTGLDYAECFEEAKKMISEASKETRINAIKAALLEINELNKKILSINAMLELATDDNWKPLLTKYANDVFEID